MLKRPKPKPFECIAAWCRTHGYPEPVPEHAFALPVREWRFDAAWPSLKLALEFEGGTFLPGGGGHTRGPAHRDDCDKFNEAQLRDWRVLRVLTSEATSAKTLGMLHRAMASAGAAPRRSD